MLFYFIIFKIDFFFCETRVQISCLFSLFLKIFILIQLTDDDVNGHLNYYGTDTDFYATSLLPQGLIFSQTHF